MLVEPHTAIPFNSIKQTFVADVKFLFFPVKKRH